VHVRVEVRDVNTPGQRLVDLGAAFGAHILRFHPCHGRCGRSRKIAAVVVQRGAPDQ
jgi:hypothetical protein